MRLPDGRRRAYYAFGPGDPSQQTIASAVSSDGLPLPDGRIRLFWTGGDGLDSATSAGGLDFTLEPAPMLPLPYAADPAAVQLPGGGYLLAVATVPSDPQGRRIFLARPRTGRASRSTRRRRWSSPAATRPTRSSCRSRTGRSASTPTG